MSTEELIRTIKQQDEIIGRLTRENESLQNTVSAFNSVTRKRKQQLGYDQNVSFDVVFADLVAKAKKYDQWLAVLSNQCKNCFDGKITSPNKSQ